MVNWFDSSILHSMDLLASKWPNFDRVLEFVTGNALIQGTLAAACFWWYWFRSDTETTMRRTREHLVATLYSSVAAIIVARTMADALPFRVRPRWETALGYVIPSAPNANVYVNWSSFPSDHAVLFASIAAGFCFISARTGTFLFLYYLAISALPLMFLGYHYPTDIIAGSLIGVAISCVFNSARIREPLSRPVLRWERASQSSFFAALFFVTYQIASMFNSVRSAALAMSHFIDRLI